MSIPPFVCNTPPPPDQCEDDRDVDYYDDIPYNLSQEEYDEGDLGFGVATYNYADNTRIPAKNHEATENHRIEGVNHFKRKSDEHLEDLTINIENVSITHRNSEHQIIDNENIDLASTSKHSDKTMNDNSSYNDKSKQIGIQHNTSESNSYVKETKVEDNLNQDKVNILENICKETVCEVVANSEVFQNEPGELKPDLDTKHQVDLTVLSDKNELLPQINDDDFGEFEDFKVNSSNEPPTPIDDFNPWQTEACAEPNFQATFESSGFGEKSDEDTLTAEDDDDFGDFDDFRSNTNIEHSTSSKDYDSVISSSPNSINDAVINKVVCSLFEEELQETENSNIKKLESSLSETWRHLLQVEERQPYMVNWNNSVTQKALLKSLCIDSRNILFVPKWGSNTPRYAANLCVTPLQPQKQSTSFENSVFDPPSASNNAWVNPSSQHGQESTYAEALLLDLENLMATLDQMAHNQSALKISDLLSQACCPEEAVPPAYQAPSNQPTLTAADLDMLDLPSNANKVYSGAVNVQPIRQISLPDTHIFTPSNSEIPRSKTIHYDCGPTILIREPQTSVSATDDDFSDFQDFKRSPENTDSGNAGIASNVNSVVATKQVLEPIKMDIVTPSINWPEPGQIKETFDDFSEFIVSNTLDNVDNTPSLCLTAAATSFTSCSVESNHVPSASDDQYDDDFNKFQSAISSKCSIDSQNIVNPIVSPTPTTFSSNVTSFIKEDFLSITNNSVNSFQMEPTNFNSIPPKMNLTSQPSSEILQPLSISTMSSHKSNSGQILQPLSLESYSQISWPNPGLDLQDLSRFNPIETVPTLKNDCNSASGSKHASPARVPKAFVTDDDGWGEFVSIKPKQQQAKPSPTQQKHLTCDEDEWSDFVSSSTIKPQNGLNTISFNVHTNQNIQKPSAPRNKSSNQISIDVPTLNYITPKANNQNVYSSKHLNL